MSSLLCLNLNHFRIQNKTQGLDKGNENVVDIRSATNTSTTVKVDSKESTEDWEQAAAAQTWWLGGDEEEKADLGNRGQRTEQLGLIHAGTATLCGGE